MLALLHPTLRYRGTKLSPRDIKFSKGAMKEAPSINFPRFSREILCPGSAASSAPGDREVHKISHTLQDRLVAIRVE